ncbi:DUF805 domain-containing protein [Paenibacillus sp. OAS669]|uniref:DUF805 domain-containing protein n=1 Tax=Paenibacillus sp. OAS669 TaxID=2663821 RepID=UPI00178B6653|nr:DUF805 domain-containing protein [Paenibacillus sp. OAS669]MBE1442392.1 uncharacterized membrane protein YhaH (DUF805 family) [Paenibacillus sp. OAS669]
MEWYMKVIKNYAGFEGRARRQEYWMFVLFNVIISVVLSLLSYITSLFSILSMLYALAILVPSIAVGARRLHDTGRSGWMLLIGLIPIIGSIILIVFMCQDSQAGDNQYGPNPKGDLYGNTTHTM